MKHKCIYTGMTTSPFTSCIEMAQSQLKNHLIEITYDGQHCLCSFPHPIGATESQVVCEFRKDAVCIKYIESLHTYYAADEDENLVGITIKLLAQSDNTEILGMIESVF
jgi:hypothetical protein